MMCWLVIHIISEFLRKADKAQLLFTTPNTKKIYYEKMPSGLPGKWSYRPVFNV